MNHSQDYMRRSEEVADRILDKSRQLLAKSLDKKLRSSKHGGEGRTHASPSVKNRVKDTFSENTRQSRSPKKHNRRPVDPRLIFDDYEDNKGDINFNLLDPNLYR